MANLRDIRNRIESIKNTRQITKAMKMVAAAKLRKAQNRIIATRPYASKMKEVVARLVGNATDKHQLLREPESTDEVLFIIIGSDRGLCGAFNNNLFKMVEKTIEQEYAEYRQAETLSLVCVGRKAIKHFGKRNYNVIAEYPDFFDEINFAKASGIMKGVIKRFNAGEFDEVKLAYNEFKSVIAQERIVESVLPIEPSALLEDAVSDNEQKEYIYEPGIDKILEDLLPSHLNLQLWKAILESNAAEQGARMTAMDNATENANELQEDLELEYNRARQSAITTEISEIISGAQALENA
ncbi:ATP synthase F1 subunit gamma [Fodinibius sediminis]|uniref:ATP synthase gamma chain n=1 Tax=Fodinibius sediminis TaxID=1214077 RepID=A0A521B714_9BACT|nr:ATP synthase F1 subunit gamma [Fodinibius sediminis]SMO42897.1 ATP synthase F1 subcomplex gamma subunit [Fodinibius sediminis]